MACIVASVPELVKRTRSTAGARSQMYSAHSTSARVGAPGALPTRTVSVAAATTSSGACPWTSEV
jgi:hypothetical protein